MTYYYYSKKDTTREKIDKCECEDVFEAIKYFSQKKNLSEDKFKELFEVRTTYIIKV